ncbi:thermonuclease family protein [Phreatobacter aquaticus]|uniref:Thermonuclease family protein n=1 Tax=Phreatobacter aquaticus TaxID=2570229 RepID=A0A4D7QHI1_9HYPH|nr:thermonuclease family protein [Phreatobacter aquaticus]QCK86768.1 thermonuclease family protein [Phreatobacter aquaticus]
MLLTCLIVGATIAAYVLNRVPVRPHITGHARIIDGDSLMVGGTEVRLHGVDAPELFQRCTRDNREVQCGREAARHLTALIAGQVVTCERRDIDRFGRTVAVCRVDGVDLGRAMVANGQAVSYGSYLIDEAGARLERKGLWAGTFIRPREWRDRERGRFAPGA